MKWTANLAYAVGLITTDGSLSCDGRHINLTSKDYEQIVNFKKILNLKNKIGLKYSSYTHEKKYYQVQFGDVKLYRFLLKIGLTPAKTKTIGAILIPRKYFPDFLRGHLDGDGCTYSYWDPRWKSSFMFYSTFISASNKHIYWLEEYIIKYYKLKGAVKKSRKSTYSLRFAKYASQRLMGIIYYRKDLVCLRRKRLKIEKSLSIIQGEKAGVEELADSQD